MEPEPFWENVDRHHSTVYRKQKTVPSVKHGGGLKMLWSPYDAVTLLTKMSLRCTVKPKQTNVCASDSRVSE